MRFSSITNLAISNFIHILNDSMFKMSTIFYLLLVCGPEYRTSILTFNGLAFALPYIIFSVPASKLTLYFDCKKIMILNKILEMILLSSISIYAWLRLFVVVFHPGVDIAIISLSLFLLGTRTCAFVPCRYFIVSHMFEGHVLKKAASLISLSTYAGLLCGLILSSVISDLLDKNYSLVFLFNTTLSVLSTILIFCFRFPKISTTKKYQIQAIELLKIYTEKGSKILISLIANSVFMGASVFYQMNIVSYAIDVMKYDETYSGYIYFAVGLGMLIGIIIAFFLCKKFERNYLQISGAGSILFGIMLTLLNIGATNFIAVIIMIISGVMMGISMIPIEISIQGICPKTYIAINMGLCNFIGFIAIAVAAVFIYLGGVFNIHSGTLFAISGACVMVFGVILSLCGNMHIKKMHIK
ncbi:MAG: MFS transporter [Chlamydiia bacterium]|nr:MFS transporter [Chlamydiia bacterium]